MDQSHRHGKTSASGYGDGIGRDLQAKMTMQKSKLAQSHKVSLGYPIGKTSFGAGPVRFKIMANLIGVDRLRTTRGTVIARGSFSNHEMSARPPWCWP